MRYKQIMKSRQENYVMHSISFQTFLYRHLKLSYTLEHSVCYCYTSYEMTGQFLWFQVERNSYSSNWNTPYKNLIARASEFQKCYLDVRTLSFIIIMSCRQHGNSWSSLATFPCRSSPLAGLQGYITYPHIAAVCCSSWSSCFCSAICGGP